MINCHFFVLWTMFSIGKYGGHAIYLLLWLPILLLSIYCCQSLRNGLFLVKGCTQRTLRTPRFKDPPPFGTNSMKWYQFRMNVKKKSSGCVVGVFFLLTQKSGDGIFSTKNHLALISAIVGQFIFYDYLVFTLCGGVGTLHLSKSYFIFCFY